MEKRKQGDESHLDRQEVYNGRTGSVHFQQKNHPPAHKQPLESQSSSGGRIIPAPVGVPNQYAIPHIHLLESNPVALPKMALETGNPQHMLYQQSLAGITNMVAAVPTSSTSEDILGDSSTTSSSIKSRTSTTMGAPQINSNARMNSQINGQAIPQSFSAPLSQSTTLGGVHIPPLPPNSSTAMQVQVAAAAAAAAAAPPKGYHGPKPGTKSRAIDSGNVTQGTNSRRGVKRGVGVTEMTAEQKKNLNRERNREHAKSTRARKKAYVSKLKELVDGLHAERSEEARKRRVTMEHLAEVQRVRRAVIKNFLQLHAGYESDPRKWSNMLEDQFYLKQPVTPYRSFRKSEVENTRDRECRKSRGIDAVICDSASMSVMVESVGNRSARWKHIKREDFLMKEELKTGSIRSRMPRSIVREDSRLQHAISSLSSSSGYSTSNGSSGEEDKKKLQSHHQPISSDNKAQDSKNKRKKVSSSSSGGSGGSREQVQESSNNLYHDYHAQPLPDPKLDSGNSAGSDSLSNDSDNAVVGKHLCTDSSSGDEDKPRRVHRKKCLVPPTLEITTNPSGLTSKVLENKNKSFPSVASVAAVTDPSSNSEIGNSSTKIGTVRSNLPPNIARSGGISHNIRPVVPSSNPRLSTAPAIQLPPFLGLGKRPKAANPNVSVSRSNSSSSGIAARSRPLNPSNVILSSQPVGSHASAQPFPSTSSQQLVNIIGADNDAGSSEESSAPHIQAFYHVNEDDMLLTDDILMCPFIFRTQDAVLCGALAECVMPGMLRAQFSSRNKLLSLEMVYDSMGFMQQLGRASGNEAVADIIPNSLEMSLQPSSEEARVITTAKPPFFIVSANGQWTKITKFTQMEVEKKDLSIVEGKRTDQEVRSRPGKPSHDLVSVTEGKAACSTNVFYDKYGKPFIAFVATYPLTNSSDEITHLLHIYNELPEFS